MLPQRYAAVPRVDLAFAPTRLHALKRLSAALGGPQIWIKRDDLTGAAGGGNKVRKLEFLLGEALAQRADTVITAGAVQSNHVRQTAAACASLGLACEAVLTESVTGRSVEYDVSGNLLLSRMAGARLHRVPGDDDPDRHMQAIAQRLRGEGKRPFIVPVGGATPAGSLGYVSAAFELLAQLREAGATADVVVHASGTGGTQAGLVAGFALAGAPIRVLGISVGAPAERQRRKVAQILPGLAALLEIPAIPEDAILVDDRSTGPAYGQPTAEMKAALHELVLREGIYLDPVYTGKAMAGLLRLCRSGELARGQNIVFLHTGGGPGLFAYSGEFS